MVLGTVKWFNPQKGFGFIVSEDKDHFVYYHDIIAEGFKTLVEGDNVEFEAVKGERGMQARKVRVIS